MMNQRAITTIGLLTWVVAGIPDLAFIMHGRGGSQVWIACYVAFGVLFVVAMRAAPRKLVLVLIAAQSATALTLVWLEPALGYIAILLVIVAAELGVETSFRAALVGITVQSAVMALIVDASGTVDAPLTMILGYLLFQVFGAVTAHSATTEARARRELATSNAEVRVSAALLEMQNRMVERLRIARDLHDLIGHHLTALSLNLEAAGHLANPETKKLVETARLITRLLLADVRDVVSRMRESEPVDLTRGMLAIREVISSPAIHVSMPHDLSVSDPDVARVALRCAQEIATNAVRHSGAHNLRLALARSDSTLTIDAHDDGRGVEVIRLGNGLRGMRERVESVHGSVEFESRSGHGFSVHVELPVCAKETA